MSKSSNQKLKLMYISKILHDMSDQDHPISMDSLISSLSHYGISAERKSIYSDIEALQTFGMDIQLLRGRGYYLANREFELPELKLLVDSVQASKFITEKKSSTLIKKLISLSSHYEGQLINRQVFVKDRIKSMNESIYYNVDFIHSCIAANTKVKFRYFEFTANKEKHYKKDGKMYCVSPYALIWSDENYYMVAYDSEAEKIKHYRVDKMDRISDTDIPRDGKDCFAGTNVAEYSKRIFSMYGGEEITVSMEFSNYLAGSVIDKFGIDVAMMPIDDDHFRARANVFISPKFFSWVFGFRGAAVIVSPQSVIDEYKAHIASVMDAQNNAKK